MNKDPGQRQVARKAISAVVKDFGTRAAACAAFWMPLSTYYLKLKPVGEAGTNAIAKPPRALNAEERQRIEAVLHEDRFMDKAPREIYAQLLDEGIYRCSPRTMYRILHSLDEVKHRRNIRHHPHDMKPELQEVAHNAGWHWDMSGRRPARGA